MPSQDAINKSEGDSLSQSGSLVAPTGDTLWSCEPVEAPPFSGQTAGLEPSLSERPAALILQTLEMIKCGQRIELPLVYSRETGLASQLVDAGLVEQMSNEDYRRHKRQASALDALNERITKAETDTSELARQLCDMKERHDNFWHRAALRFSLQFDALADEARAVREKNQRLLEQQEQLDSLRCEQQKLNPQIQDVSRFAPSNEGYLALTAKGAELLRNLQARREELGQMKLSELEHDTPGSLPVRSELLSSPVLMLNIKLLEDLHARLSEVHGDDNPHLINFALALSFRGDDARQLLREISPITDLLQREGLLALEGFNAAAVLAGGPEPVGQICEKYEIFLSEMFDAGHRRSVTTAVEAAAVMEILTDDPTDAMDIQNEYRCALRDYGWIYGAHATCYIAAKLAQRELGAHESAREHHEMEKALIEAGHTESVDLGYAALILLDAPGDVLARVRRFSDAVRIIGSCTQHYPTAAHIAAMPGDTADISQKTAEARDLLTSHNIQDPWGALALSLLAGKNLVLPVIDEASPSASPRSKAGKIIPGAYQD